MTDSISKYYNEVRTDYGINSLRRKKILSLLGETPGRRILDVGCASGYLAKDIKSRGHWVAGADVSGRYEQDLKSSLDDFSVLNIEEDVWPTGWRENRFDTVIAAEIVEHLFYPEKFFDNLKKILNPGGEIILSTPNFLVWNNRLRLLLGRWTDKEIFFDRGHIRLFSYQSIVGLIEKQGYKIIQADHVWYPNSLEKIHAALPPNLFVFQTIIKIKSK